MKTQYLTLIHSSRADRYVFLFSDEDRPVDEPKTVFQSNKRYFNKDLIIQSLEHINKNPEIIDNIVASHFYFTYLNKYKSTLDNYPNIKIPMLQLLINSLIHV